MTATNSPTQYGMLLVAGSHTHQENYARAFAADSRCRLIGLTDEADIPLRRKSLNLRLASELEIPYFEDIDAAFHRDDVQIVCLCPEPERRMRLVEQAAQAGKHVYIDKPIGTSLEDGSRMVAAIEQAGVTSQMFSLVRSPVAQRAKQTLESGEIGELLAIDCELCFAKGHAGSADLSIPRTESEHTDRFTFIDAKRELFCVGLYPLVLFQWLTGQRFQNLFATTGNYFFESHQRHNVEDFASMMLTLDGGLQASLFVGRTGWTSHPNYGVHQIHLVGSRRTVTLDAFRPRLEVWNADAWTPPPTPHPEDPMGFWSSTQSENGILPKAGWQPIETAIQSDAAYFLDCLDENRPSDVCAKVGFHALQAILRGYQSAAVGQWISLL
ncbi:Gfo/Idh/MocA family protein [Thalassoroseus pseudoceratinae]|uniref:Gfo/Idh/MocA family protein n=1 Tax=Thalassoroseus pseudoceratinae TaxID=2713176 RepID=UPI00141E4A75|nr:Gfo/Idh/MocA family oxidoreductase [Thalassoroseus pseudoceratinae]